MHISWIKKNSKTRSRGRKNRDSRNTAKKKSLFTIHAKQKYPFTLLEKSIEDPHQFGKTDQILVGYFKHVSTHVSLNPSEYFGIRCVRISTLMIASLISAGDQVALV